MIAGQFWWHLARVSGIVAWVMLCASVMWGLLLSTRVLGRRPNRPWLLEMHRYFSTLALWSIGIHLVSLYADSYVQFSPADLLIPMSSPWRPGAVAWGIMAMYILVDVEATSLVMDRLPRRLWKGVHVFSIAAFSFGTVHGLLAGTDRGNTLVGIAAFVGVAEVAFVLIVRLVYRRQTWRSVEAH